MTLDSLKPLLDWIQANPNFAGFFVFLVSFLESLAIVGLLIPGAVVMPAIGTLIGSQILPALPIFMWAAAGSVLGDFISYWLGHHFKEHIREMWPFYKVPNMLNSGMAFFKKHGGKSVVLGRYIGIMRPVTPLIAGMMSMLPSRFLLASILASVTWAPIYMLPGIIVGAASLHLAPQVATRLTLFVLMLTLVSVLTGWLIKRLCQYLIFYFHQFLSVLWKKMRQQPRLQLFTRFLEDPTDPHHHAQWLLFFYSTVSLIIFSLLIYLLYDSNFISGINYAALHLLRSIRTDTAYKIMVAVTQMGGWSLIVMALSVFALLAVQRHWRAAFHMLSCTFLTFLSLHYIKIGMHFPRPRGLIASPSDWAFPSGHTGTSVAILGFFGVLLSSALPKHRKIIFFIIILFIALISFSRLYLGVHWTSDIAGGILLGTLICLMITISYYRGKISSLNPASLLLVGVLGWSAGWILALLEGYQSDFQNYKLTFPTRIIDVQEWWNELLPADLLIRTDRFGNPVQLLNVQWTGKLPDIERYLTQKKWIKVPKSNFQNIITRIASYRSEDRLPLLPKMYLDRKPSLIFSKVVDNKTIILRLWKTHIILMPNQVNLWAGTVEYYHPGHSTELSTVPPAIQILEKDLKKLEWKKMDYPCINHPQEVECGGQILLIKER